MNFLSNIRAQLGISQQNLAFLLGISREQLNLAEMGRRQLPATALNTVVQLQEALLQKGKEVKPAASKRLTPRLAAELEETAAWCADKGRHYIQLAELIVAKNEQANNCLAVLPQVFNALEASDPDDAAVLTLKIIAANSRKQLRQYPMELAQRCIHIGAQLLSIK